MPSLHLIPWTYTPREGFTVRGQHSPPSGKPVLHFLHGNGFCGLAYEPMLVALSEHFDLWLSDVQGHGDSDHGERFVGWNRNADIALEAFERHQRALFGTVPCMAVGHSFGGVLTCLMLATRPKLFHRAVVLDPVLMPAMLALAVTMAEGLGLSGHHAMARSARRRRRHWPDRTSAADGLRGRGTYKGWREDALQAFVTHAMRASADGGVELKCDPQREAEIFSSAATGVWSALRQVKTPTLLIHGEHTFDFVLSSAAQWIASNPVASALQVEGGHCFMQERPESTANLISEFLLPP